MLALKEKLIDTAGKETRVFPSWHFSMLNDRKRSDAIELAIKSLDLSGKIVFEIGSGSGLIALLFAKYGAKKVITCESCPQMFEIAKKIVNASDYRRVITLINASSSEVISGNLLNEQPDIIFTETLDCGIVGEGFFNISNDISKIAKPNTAILPNKICQNLALVNSEEIFTLNYVNEVSSFDLTVLNNYSTRTYFPVRASLYRYSILSSQELVRKYQYGKLNLEKTFSIKIEKSGECHGAFSWFNAHFGDNIISNSPYVNSHWHNAFHPLNYPISVSKGDVLQLRLDNVGRLWLIKNERNI
jgi:protein arginine N-methyltransferase 1